MKNIMAITAALLWGCIVVTAADPGLKDDSYTRALTLIKANKYDTAGKLLDEAIKKHPDSVSVLSALAYVDEKQGRNEAAISRYQRVIALSLNRLLSKDGAKRFHNAGKALKRLSPSISLLLQYAADIERASGNFTGTDKIRADKAVAALYKTALAKVVVKKIQKKPVPKSEPSQPGWLATAKKTVPKYPDFHRPWLVPGVELEMILIPSGSFTMGSNDGFDDEKPAHEVVLTYPFYLGKLEVTQRQFSQFVNATGHVTQAETEAHGWGFEMRKDKRYGSHVRMNGRNWRATQMPAHGDLPVVYVGANDCDAFCSWLTGVEQKARRLPDGYAYRLPTEAEWEYSYRAGTTTKFFWGDAPDKAHRYANLHGFSNDLAKGDNVYAIARGGQFGANPWGLYDMAGNVYEWTYDGCITTRGTNPSKFFTFSGNDYPDGTRINPLSLLGRARRNGARIFRGGCWMEGPSTCRASWRMGDYNISQKTNWIGYRVALAPKPDFLKREREKRRKEITQ